MTRLELLEDALSKYMNIMLIEKNNNFTFPKSHIIHWLAWRKLDFKPKSIRHLTEEIRKERNQLVID